LLKQRGLLWVEKPLFLVRADLESEGLEVTDDLLDERLAKEAVKIFQASKKTFHNFYFSQKCVTYLFDMLIFNSAWCLYDVG
jgi:hypothetical protein